MCENDCKIDDSRCFFGEEIHNFREMFSHIYGSNFFINMENFYSYYFLEVFQIF